MSDGPITERGDPRDRISNQRESSAVTGRDPADVIREALDFSKGVTGLEQRNEALAALGDMQQRQAETERKAKRRTNTADRYREKLLASVCGVVIHSSWHEPVACAYRPGHDGDHSWASIPALPPAVAAEADRDGLATALKYADQKIAAVEADRDRLQEAKDNWHRSYVLCRQERDRYRDALEQIVACDFRGNMPREQSIARAALATPDTLPPHVERAIREVEKTATKEVREQTGRDDLVVEFDRRAATPDTPPTSRYSGTPDSPTVRNGVCLLCGSAILSSGIHLRADLPPCYGAPDTPPDARC
jgi:hypothetical protein